MRKTHRFLATSLTLISFVFSLAVSVNSQDVKWTPVKPVNPGLLADVNNYEEGSDGSFRETRIWYHSGTTNIAKSEITLIKKDGTKTVTTKRSRPDGTQEEFEAKVSNLNGAILSGNKWETHEGSFGHEETWYQVWDTNSSKWVDDLSKPSPLRVRVHVRHVGSRQADAQRARELLKSKGLDPVLVPIPERSGHLFKGRLVFYRRGDGERANSMVQMLAPIEAVTPYLREADSKETEPSDRHFQISLFAKKQPLVRIGYTESRKADAGGWESTLEGLGFTVETELVQEADVKGNVKGLLFYHHQDDRSVADAISKSYQVDSKSELTPTLRTVSAEAKPPDFQFVLTGGAPIVDVSWFTEVHTLGWTTIKSDAQSQNRIIRAKCPPNPGKAKGHGSGYGTDNYLMTSAICPMAVHAGVITFDQGGVVTIEFVDGSAFNHNYVGSKRNGVTTESWQRNWGGFRFVKR